MSEDRMSDSVAALIESVAVACEKGELGQWLKPWSTDGLMPVNHWTRRAYTGLNIIVLWGAMRRNAWESCQFLTFNQLRELNQHHNMSALVKKGEKASHVIAWVDQLPTRYVPIEADPDYVYDQISKEMVERRSVTRLFARCHPVFNITQISWPASYTAHVERQPPSDAYVAVTAAAYAQDAGATVISGQHQACYIPGLDRIEMPPAANFVSGQHYAGTLFHELVHWTGHVSRCNRIGEGQAGSRGMATEAYAFEELVAEFGAAMLCASHGFTAELQHAEYLAHWASRIRADRYGLINATKLAQKAITYLDNQVHLAAMRHDSSAA